jgi:hypothetical protein
VKIMSILSVTRRSASLYPPQEDAYPPPSAPKVLQNKWLGFLK